MAFDVRPILWPLTIRPAFSLSSVTAVRDAVGVLDVGVGYVSEIGVIGSLSSSAWNSAAAAWPPGRS